MSSYLLNINDKAYKVQTSPNMPLLWILRDMIGLSGARFGCGKGFCGACTVHADGRPIRACITAIEAVKDQAILTIEGLSADRHHPLQRAWKQYQAAQCGDCRAGQIMAAAALLNQYDTITEAIIEREMAGVLCRCGSYRRIRQAILCAAQDRHAQKSA